jgi:ribonuclease HI
MVAILHFDGASKGNPGKAGAGAVLMTEDGRVVLSILNALTKFVVYLCSLSLTHFMSNVTLKISRLREGLGVVTNNVAEYRGLILGLKYAIRHGFRRIKVHGDSQLVCNQVCLSSFISVITASSVLLLSSISALSC